MDIKEVYLVETSENLYKEIKGLEEDRIKNDLTNKDKFTCLYELYYSALDKLSAL